MTWNVKTVSLWTDGINQDLWMMVYKNVKDGELILTLADRQGVKFNIPKGSKKLMKKEEFLYRI
jgi:hypothetical protein